jgi:GDP-D-mannose dehydratase
VACSGFNGFTVCAGPRRRPDSRHAWESGDVATVPWVAAGEVREFLDQALGCAGLEWHDYVTIDERYFSAAEVDMPLGDASKAKVKLAWESTIRFDELVRIMDDREVRHTEEHYV